MLQNETPSGAAVGRRLDSPDRRFAALERALVKSFELATPEPARRRSGLRVQAAGPCTVIACDAVPHLLVNRLVVPSDVGVRWEKDIASALEVLRSPRHRHNYIVHVDPSAEAPQIEQALRDFGLTPFRRDWVVLRHDQRPALDVETPFRLAPAGRREAGAFAEVVAQAFDGPSELLPMLSGLVDQAGWHVYVACDGPRVIAGGALFVHAGTAYLGFAATLRSHRGAGAHDALIARRLRLACALGCDLLLVETGAPVPGEPSPSLDNLCTAGFEPVFTRKNYAAPGTTWTG